MEIKSYKDMNGNKVVKGDLVEVTYDENKIEQIGKISRMEKRWQQIWINLEGEGNGWRWGTKHTRKIIE